METDELTQTLKELGCPPEKATEMAAQLDKRARQLMVKRGESYEQTAAYLLNLMRQGWAAQGRVNG